MSDATETQADTPDQGNQETTGTAEGETPSYATAAELKSLSSRNNSEFAGLRKKLNGLAELLSGTNGETPATNGSGNGHAVEDIDAKIAAAMRVGALHEKLPEPLRDVLAPVLEGKSFAEQASALEIAALVAGATPKLTSTGPGRTQTNRAATNAQRGSASLPERMSEYLHIAATDPIKKKKIDDHPLFNPAELIRDV